MLKKFKIAFLKYVWPYRITILLFATPAIINYGFFTWDAPWVFGGPDEWLGFLGSYLGLLGAIYVATYQIKKQKEISFRQDMENNRSYLVVQDFNATLMLVGVKTNENSRIILTDGFEKLKRNILVDDYRKINVSYLKLSHFGDPSVITDCNIYIVLKYTQNDEEFQDIIDINIGAIEKEVEMYVPLTPLGIKRGNHVGLDTVVVSFTTLRGERLKLTHDYINKREIFESVTEGKVLFSNGLKSAYWIYPNKTDLSVLKQQ